MKPLKRKDGTVRTDALLLIVVAIAVFITIAAIWAFSIYEDGILDICASQQDSYVKLVVGQINLKENRDDSEMVSKILSTLDQSSGRYWTLSRDQEMLFIKDTLETSRYKLTAGSYYEKGTASEFFENLNKIQVHHARIKLGDKEYIASGMEFENGGQTYKVCLLTNTGVILDNNRFLRAKSILIALLGIAFTTMSLIPLILSMAWNREVLANNSMDTELREMRLRIGKMNDRLSTQELYDSRKNLFQLQSLPLFLGRYRDRHESFPISLTAWRYDQDTTIAEFFGTDNALFGKKDIKFYDGRLHLALVLAISCDEETTSRLISMIHGRGECLGTYTAYYPEFLDDAVKNILKDMGDPDINTDMSTGKRPDSRTESVYRAKDKTLQQEERKEAVDTTEKIQTQHVSARTLRNKDARIVEEDKDVSLEKRIKALESLAGFNNGDLTGARIKRLEDKLNELLDMERRVDWLEERAGLHPDTAPDPDYDESWYCDVNEVPTLKELREAKEAHINEE